MKITSHFLLVAALLLTNLVQAEFEYSPTQRLKILSTQAKLFGSKVKVLNNLEPEFANINSSADLDKLYTISEKFGHQIVWTGSLSDSVFIFFHGLYGTSSQFLADAETLGKFGFNSILVNLKGHGVFEFQDDNIHFESWKEQSKAALHVSRLLGKKAILVGQSTGGALALWLSHQFWERVNAVVAIEPAIQLSDNLNMICPLSKVTNDFCQFKSLAAALGYRIQEQCPLSIDMACQVSKLANNLFPEVRKTRRKPGHPAKSNSYKKEVFIKEGSLLFKPLVPTTIVYAEADRIVENRVFEVLSKSKDANLSIQMIKSTESKKHGLTDSVVLSDPAFQLALLKAAKINLNTFSMMEVVFTDEDALKIFLLFADYSWASEYLKPFVNELEERKNLSIHDLREIGASLAKDSIILKVIFNRVGLIDQTYSIADFEKLIVTVEKCSAVCGIKFLRSASTEFSDHLKIPDFVFKSLYWKLKKENSDLTEFIKLLESSPFPYGNNLDLGLEIKDDLFLFLKSDNTYLAELVFKYLVSDPVNYPNMSSYIDEVLISGEEHDLFWYSLLKAKNYSNLSPKAEEAIYARLTDPREQVQVSAADYFTNHGVKSKELRSELLKNEAKVKPWASMKSLRASWDVMNSIERDVFFKLLKSFAEDDKYFNLALETLLLLYNEKVETSAIFESFLNGSRGLRKQRAAYDHLHLRLGSKQQAVFVLIDIATTHLSYDSRAQAILSLYRPEVLDVESSFSEKMLHGVVLDFIEDKQAPEGLKVEVATNLGEIYLWTYSDAVQRLFCIEQFSSFVFGLRESNKTNFEALVGLVASIKRKCSN